MILPLDTVFDLIIYAVPRSGSTWLADRLSKENESIVYIEPFITEDGIELTEGNLKHLELIGKPEKVGIKVIRFTDLFLNLKAKKKLLLVRDHRDVQSSMREFEKVRGRDYSANVEEAIRGAISFELKFPEISLAKYEYMGEKQLIEIANWSGFSVGCHRYGLVTHAPHRLYEKKRHGLLFSKKTIGRGYREGFTADSEYQSMFGYSLSALDDLEPFCWPAYAQSPDDHDGPLSHESDSKTEAD